MKKSKSFWFQNGLSIALFILFIVCLGGQFYTGWKSHNDDLKEHKQSEISAVEYVQTGHFIEATFENWESEFLQMAIFVWLTKFLYQRGSAESNPLPDENQDSPQLPKRYFINRPVLRALYERSLGLSLFIIFILSFLLHLYGGLKEENLKRAISPKHEPAISAHEFVVSSNFWFQSFQNWQSEFLSVFGIVVLSIFLRDKDSAQSKDVDAPHWQTDG